MQFLLAPINFHFMAGAPLHLKKKRRGDQLHWDLEEYLCPLKNTVIFAQCLENKILWAKSEHLI